MDLPGVTSLIGSRVTGARGIMVRRAGDGIVISDGRPQPLWVRVTGPAVDDAFPWEEVYQDAAGVWTVLDEARAGDALYMADSASSATEGSIVYAIPHPSEGWLIGILAGQCLVPAGIRIDGGDAAAGYDFTVMVQTNADPSEFEEFITSDVLGFKAYEANGLEVTAGTTIYPGQVDYCKEKAFFFGGADPGEFYIEFQETTPSVGDLHLAKIIDVFVDSDGLPVYTEGATVLALPLNQTIPTLETIYEAERSDDDSTVNGLITCKAYHCCDAVTQDSSSGSGGMLGITNDICTDLPEFLTVLVAHDSSTELQEYTLELNVGLNEWSNTDGTYAPLEGCSVSIDIQCVDGIAYCSLNFSTIDGTNHPGYGKSPGAELSWNAPSEWNEGLDYQLVVTEAY